MSTQIYKAKDAGALFVQLNGPNSEPVYIGCHDLDDFEEKEGGIAELYRCILNGQYTTVGFSEEPPEPIPLSLSTYIGPVREYLEKITRGALYILLRDTGVPDLFTNWHRAFVVDIAKRSGKSRTGLAKRDTDAAAMLTVTLQALPPIMDLSQFKVMRQTTGETQALNDLSFLQDKQPWTAPGGAKFGGRNGFAGADSAAGPATANVQKTTDGGGTWAAAATDPFAAAEHVGPVITFPRSGSAFRILVGRAVTDAAAPPEVAYSDNNGATWTAVSLGSTNALFFRAGPRGLFHLDYYHIWAVVSAGGIFFSGDGGLTWTQQGASVTANDLNAIHMANAKVGYAAGEADTILKTVDGGTTWAAVTATGSGANILTIDVLDENRVWVGLDDGTFFYSLDGGTTWTARRFTGLNARYGVGDVKDIEFLNDYVGLMIADNASPVGEIFLTKDGGYTWEPITTPTNAGLNAVHWIDSESFFSVGEPQGGTAVILKGYAN